MSKPDWAAAIIAHLIGIPLLATVLVVDAAGLWHIWSVLLGW